MEPNEPTELIALAKKLRWIADANAADGKPEATHSQAAAALERLAVENAKHQENAQLAAMSVAAHKLHYADVLAKVADFVGHCKPGPKVANESDDPLMDRFDEMEDAVKREQPTPPTGVDLRDFEDEEKKMILRVAALEAENARLSGELATTKLDTARHGGTVGPYMGGETVSIQIGNRPRETTRGIRAAIDAALAKTP